MNANMGPGGSLGVKLVHADGRSVEHPALAGLFERILRGGDDAAISAADFFQTRLRMHHRNARGEVVDHSDTHNVGSDGAIDLGSGLVTNVGVTALANDFAWAQNCQTLKLANYHAVGTGTTAAAATDLQLQTPASPTASTAQVGTQSLISAANLQKYQTVSTFNFGASEAITEWGLHTAAALSATTGSPFTATSATGATVTGTPYTASSTTAQGEQQLIVKAGTTTVYGLITSNTTSQLVIPAWYTVAGGTAGSTPGATEAFTLLPVMLDHKVFAAVNVSSGDSLQVTYDLTIASGG